MRFPIHRGLRDTGRAGALSLLRTGDCLAATAAVLLLAACARRETHDEIIAGYTRAYVSGHINYQRYRELCVALNGEPTYPRRSSESTEHSSSSDTSSSGSDTTEQDNRHEKETRDKAHADSHHPIPPPPPPGIVAPQPPPPPRDTR